MGAGYKGYKNTSGAHKRLLPGYLLRELARSKKKYNKEEVIMITKNYQGKLLWLEKGNPRSGLEHIQLNHSKDFGINTNIPILLKSVLQTKPIKHISRNKGKHLADVYLYKKNDRTYLVAYGNNGYIVSFYPITY